jgi:hypothetical protein
MNGVPVKIAGFVAILALVLGGALALGAAVGPAAGISAAAPEHEAATNHPAPAAGHADGGTRQATAAPVAAGLAISQDGYTFIPETTSLTPGRQQDFRFTITGRDGQPVRHYVREHDKDLHLIVVRRDLSGFQHLHPTMAPDGTWSAPLTVAEAGEYRVFADFVPAGGEGLTLGVDLHAPGHYAPEPLPAPARTARVDGYSVELYGRLVAGQASELTLTVSRGGQPVTDLEPYLGAYGHLVALRDGDLAYLHVHPHGAAGDRTTPAGPAIGFTAEVPSAGTYRLYLDFKHDGVVRTAEFTATATTGASAPAVRATPSSAQHADGQPHE